MVSNMRDPYNVLGVGKSDDEKQIKSAFRKLAKKYHPDRNQGKSRAKELFAEINTAYEILGDNEKRAKFDRGEIDAEGKPRFAGFEGMRGGHGFGGPRGFGGQQGFGGAEDILSQFFGGGGSPFGQGFSTGQPRVRPSRPAKGQDIKALARITLEELATGKADVVIGPGRTVSVSIPPGTEDGQIIRLKGQGEPSASGPAGDALITIAIRPHKHFKRSGNDLRVDLVIPLVEAVLGTKARVPTLTGAVSLNIPAWSNSGNVFRIAKRGLPGKDGSVGDILVSLRISLPETPDPKLISLMKNWQSHKVGS